MSIKSLSRRGATGLLLAASVFSTASLAQDAARPAPDLGGPRGERIPVLQCCQCVGRDGAVLALNTGSSQWSVTAPGGTASQPTTPSSNAAWVPVLGSLLPPALWISPVGNPSTVGAFSYKTQFDARRCTIASTITISGQFLADNKGSIYVDGVFVKSSVGTPNYGFLPGSLTPFSYTIPAAASGGVHTVEMRADNSGGPTGVVVQLTVKRNCPKSAELPGKGQVDDAPIDDPR